jgi:hypothetical protein
LTIFNIIYKDKIGYIHELLKNCIEERNEFVVNVLKWSSSFSNRKANIGFGNPEIHREFAITLWKGVLLSIFLFLFKINMCFF